MMLRKSIGIKRKSLTAFDKVVSDYFLLYSKRDLNPHSHYWPRDFKSLVSTDSTIRANLDERKTRLELATPTLETRTRDPNLGKVVLYQLSYFRRLL